MRKSSGASIDLKAVRPALGRGSGFTLLELMVVLVIVALVMAMASVFFANTLPSSRFNATVREIVATIRYARSLAQSDSQDQAITIDLEGRRYGIEGRRTKAIPRDIGIKVVDYMTGEKTTGTCRLLFPAAGGAQGGTIVLWNKKRSLSITLDPIIGSAVTKSSDAGF